MTSDQTQGISMQQFVDIWQGSADLSEVCERTGYTRVYASQRASRLRRNLPALKRFVRGSATVEVMTPEAAKALLALKDMDAEVAKAGQPATGADGEYEDLGEEGW